uniref:Uncharacterized protein n=1 Tax=Parascaris univalens TaxID=6257 RepID=A0A915CGU1_PARUN
MPCTILEENASIEGAIFWTDAPFASLTRRPWRSTLSWLSIRSVLSIGTLLAGWSLRSCRSI